MSRVLDLDMELAPAVFPEPDDTAAIAPGIGDESDQDACCPACGRAYLDELADLELLEELRIQQDVAESVARMEAMDAHRPAPPPAPRPEPYRTPQSTVNAFWFVVRQGDEDKVVAWLADHPHDAAHLLALLEGKADA